MVDLSEKSRNAESGLYYFIARYYDPILYRFLSPDPVIPTDRALYNPQRWNLYGYCLGNPQNFIDLSGQYVVEITIVRTGLIQGGITGTFTVQTPYGCLSGYTLEPAFLGTAEAMTAGSGSAIMAGEYSGLILRSVRARNGRIIDTISLYGDNLGTRTNIWIHDGIYPSHTSGCILVGFSQDRQSGYLDSGARQAIIDLIDAATATAMENQIFEVLLGFEELPSIADFPEIIVRVSWDSNFLINLVTSISLFVMAAI